MPRGPNFTLDEKNKFVNLLMNYPILTSTATQGPGEADFRKKKKTLGQN